MLNDKLSAARKIAKAILPSEDTIDSSIAQNAQLIISIVQGRMEAGLAAESTHEALCSASEGLALLTEARGRIVSCHQQLARTRDELGLSPHATGCTVGKPSDRREMAGLTLVDQAVA
jgi:hypothetical protein